MDLANQYEYAVVAIKQAVEKSRYRAAKAGNAELLFFIMELENMFLRIQEMVFGGRTQLKLFLVD